MPLLNPTPGQELSKRTWFVQHIIYPTGTYILGRGVEDMSVGIEWNESDSRDVIGEMNSINMLASAATDIDFDLRKDDELSLWIVNAYFDRAEGDDLRVQYGEAYMQEKDDGTLEVIRANIQTALLLYNAIGGSADGATTVPCTLKKIGSPTKANYAPATSTYTAIVTP